MDVAGLIELQVWKMVSESEVCFEMVVASLQRFGAVSMPTRKMHESDWKTAGLVDDRFREEDSSVP